MSKKSDLCGIFAARIKEIREGNMWSQSELAAEMGTSSGFVCDYERGRRNPTLSTVDRFAKALGVPAADLLK